MIYIYDYIIFATRCAQKSKFHPNAMGVELNSNEKCLRHTPQFDGRIFELLLVVLYA